MIDYASIVKLKKLFTCKEFGRTKCVLKYCDIEILSIVKTLKEVSKIKP